MSKIALLFGLFLPLFAFGSEKAEIASMKLLDERLARLESLYLPGEILLVFDIDNTVLTTNQDLGGDAWFSWQEQKLKDKDTVDLVASDFAGLLEAQGWLFALGQMHPPEAETPTLLRSLQARGFSLFMLTSRGADFQNSTEKELLRNGYVPAHTAPGPKGGFAGRYQPYDAQTPQASCLGADHLARWKLPPRPQEVVYSQGVMYTSGQHKGAMLKTLLCKTKTNPQAIIFVDDHQKHVDRVFDAYENSKIDITSLRYKKMDPQVQAFQKSDKTKVASAWTKLKSTINETLK